MRQTAIITIDSPESELVTDFSVAAIQFSNPTLSPIAFRQGGTDFPSINSADFVVPAQTLLRIPAVGNQFAFQFTDVPLLQTGNISVARITALDLNETFIGIGSIQPVARPQWYEKERNAITVGQSDSTVLTPVLANSNSNPLIYTVPAARKAYITIATAKLVRTTAATTLGIVRSNWIVNAVNGNQAIFSNSVVLNQSVGASDTQSVYPQLILSAGDTLFSNRHDATPDGSGQIDYESSFAGTEFDA